MNRATLRWPVRWLWIGLAGGWCSSVWTHHYWYSAYTCLTYLLWGVLSCKRYIFFSLALQPISVLVWFAFALFLCSGSWFSGLKESGVCLDNCSILILDNFLSVYRKRAVGCKPFSFSWLQTSQHFCFKVSLLLTHAIFLPIPFSLDHLQNDWHDWNKWRASLKLAMLTSCPFPLFLFPLC